MTFEECVLLCSKNTDLVREFDRLAGTHLSTFSKRLPLDRMIDESTGRDKDAMSKFVVFVFETVWMRI